METILTITIQADQISQFSALIRAGFGMKAQTGCSVKQLLCDQLGLPEDYYDERIQTLFLNNKPVDDPETAIVKDNATLALSAAMPGLVGATFRKGGQYSWMRNSISHPDNADTTAEASGWVTVKLFNLILKELGPFFLKRGVWLRREVIQTFFEDQAAGLDASIRSISWRGREIQAKDIADLVRSEKWVFIRVA